MNAHDLQAENERLRKAVEELRPLAAINQVLVQDFAPDGRGDVTGPHLAEQEVWDALDREKQGSS